LLGENWECDLIILESAILREKWCIWIVGSLVVGCCVVSWCVFGVGLG
jgi:hypothetical protein